MFLSSKQEAKNIKSVGSL